MPFLVSCIVSDEKLVEVESEYIDDNDDDEEEPNPDPVEFIYIEPLFLFGHSFEEVKNKESISLLYSESIGDRLVYRKYTKDRVEYDVSYRFADNLLSKASVSFDFNQAILDLIVEALSDKYNKISDSPILFYNEENGRQIALGFSASDDYISIDY